MLSFLIDKCGGEEEELRELRRLQDIMRAEEEELALTTTQHAARSSVSDVAADLRSAGNDGIPLGKDDTKQALQSTPDSTALGFLLEKCVTAAEMNQFTMLPQLHMWLLHEPEGSEERAEEALDAVPNAPPHRSVVSAVSPSSPIHTTARSHIEKATERKASHEHHAPIFLAPALSSKNLPVPTTIPVPILPGAGDWKGSTVIFPATSTPEPSLLAGTVSSEDAAARGKVKEAQTGFPPGSTDHAGLLPENVEHEAAPSTRGSLTSLHRTGPIREAPHINQPRLQGAPASPSREERESDSVSSPPIIKPLPSYAGRLPRPVSEALAARNSATARLLSGSVDPNHVRATSEPRQVSRFAKRFIANLYERVSTPRGRAPTPPMVQPPPKASRHGASVAREYVGNLASCIPRTASQATDGTQRCSGMNTHGEPSPFIQEVLGRPPPARPASSLSPHGFPSSSSIGHQYRCRISTPHAAANAGAIVPRTRSSRSHKGQQPLSSAAAAALVAETPPLGLIVVGEQIRLPSLHPTPPQGARPIRRNSAQDIGARKASEARGARR